MLAILCNIDYYIVVKYIKYLLSSGLDDREYIQHFGGEYSWEVCISPWFICTFSVPHRLRTRSID
jgi:hypothetical protein